MCFKKGIPLIQLKERFLKINKQEFHRTQYILLYECVTFDTAVTHLPSL